MLFSQAASFGWALWAMMASRVGMAVTSVLNNSQLLRHTPDRFRGRVFATLESLRQGAKFGQRAGREPSAEQGGFAGGAIAPAQDERKAGAAGTETEGARQ
jgi:hypothetical protein